MAEKLLSSKELAEATGLKLNFIERSTKRLGLPSYKVGRMVKYKLSDFEVWLKQRKVA